MARKVILPPEVIEVVVMVFRGPDGTVTIVRESIFERLKNPLPSSPEPPPKEIAFSESATVVETTDPVVAVEAASGLMRETLSIAAGAGVRGR
jgi:DNA repair photolyase